MARRPLVPVVLTLVLSLGCLPALLALRPSPSPAPPPMPGHTAVAPALRARIPELAARGLRLAVVSGDVIEGTITPRLLERSAPGLLAQRRAQAGTLPTVEDMAAAVVQALADPTLPSGHTLYVGSTEP